MGFSKPKLPAMPSAPPPPPTPMQLAARPKSTAPTLGGTFLTASMPGAAPLAKPTTKKSLLGQ